VIVPRSLSSGLGLLYASSSARDSVSDDLDIQTCNRHTSHKVSEHEVSFHPDSSFRVASCVMCIDGVTLLPRVWDHHATPVLTVNVVTHLNRVGNSEMSATEGSDVGPDAEACTRPTLDIFRDARGGHGFTVVLVKVLRKRLPVN
jgi:hypothetical protein